MVCKYNVEKPCKLYKDCVNCRLVEVLQEIREEVANWHKQEPAMYVPNYDAYALFINLMDEKIEEYKE